MKGEVSDTIIVIGILGIVLITVSTAYISLNQVNFPQNEDQSVSGGVYEVSDNLATLVEGCWRQAGKGSQARQEDCFNVKVYSNDTVSQQNISNMLETMPDENFGFHGTIPEGESKVKVTYRPVDDSVNISALSICRPSNGDTCFSTQCSCQTGACGPEFDPDGDGNAETDNKGCITEYSFEPVSDPCDDLSCSEESTFSSGQQEGDYFELNLEDEIGLREAVIAEYPVSDGGEEYAVESDNKISPRESVGTGNSSRKLFTEEGRVNISELDDEQRYGLFVWGCDYTSGVPENCRWLEPYMINQNPEENENEIWIEGFQIIINSNLGLDAEIGYDLSETKTFKTELRDTSGTVKKVEKTVSGEGSISLSENIQLPDSQETYTVESDTENQVQESNEQNNKNTETFTPSTTNLEPLSIDLKEKNGDLEIQGEISYNLPEQENIKFKLYEEDTEISEKTASAQGTGTETITETVNIPANEKSFKLSADPQNNLEEDIENDNNMTKTYSPSGADLEALSLDLSENNGDLEIQGEIDYQLPEQEEFKMSLFQGTLEIKSRIVQKQNTGSETITETINAPTGTESIKLAADPQNNLNEGDIANNNITKQYTPEEEIETFTIDLEAGWNIISSPVQSSIQIDSIDSCNLNSIDDGKKGVTLRENVKYTNQINSKRGYLVKAQSGCTFQKEGIPAGKTDLSIFEGWNLISINGSMTDYTGCTGLGHGGNEVWTYNTAANAFQHSVDQLWKGFYLKSGDQCSLTKTGS